MSNSKKFKGLFYREDIIKEVDGVPSLYLRRWHLIRTPWFKLYLHKICRPDEDRDPHDHPWNSYILILKGGYTEQLFNKNRELLDTVDRPAPSLRSMPSTTVHKITQLREGGPSWSLMLNTGKIKEWGFLTKEGWVHWKNYLKDYSVVGS